MNKISEFQAINGLTADGIIGKKTIQKLKEKLNITSDIQIAHFLGQTSHETGNFSTDSENLLYSKDGLMKTFPKYFSSQLAIAYARKPDKIASRVYANRMGNGDEQSGDGWKYRGRGALQLTGKANYQAFADFIKNPDIMINPDLISTKYYFESAYWYFYKHNIFSIATKIDDINIKAITKMINGGYNGLDDRIKLTNKYFKIIAGLL